jgi:hypothetical protein
MVRLTSGVRSPYWKLLGRRLNNDRSTNGRNLYVKNQDI